jgi:hypothetical protein
MFAGGFVDPDAEAGDVPWRGSWVNAGQKMHKIAARLAAAQMIGLKSVQAAADRGTRLAAGSRN